VRVLRLLSEGGRVAGVEVAHDGAAERLVAAKGVVLATGGFGDHPEFRARFIPREVLHTPRSGTSTGELLQQALALGARFSTPEKSAAFWAPVSVRQRADGSTAVFPHFVLDRAKPGTVVVNAAGKRFVNESTSYHLFGEKMLERDAAGRCNGEAFLIADHRAFVKYGLGMVRPGGRGLRSFLRDGYLLRAASLDDLASGARIDPAALRATVDAMNRSAQTGIDEAFHRGETAYQKNLGDPAFGPNPTLGPIGQAPFYAIRLFPGDIAAIAGLVTDADARVLRDDAPIPGLFAIGNDMQSVTAGAYPGPGINLGPAIVFAYAAVKAAQRG
jgi:succinate dehydrogenase/fumarate reductase flavoprotein subunit